MKTLSKIILLSFLSFFCLAQVSIAEECKDDPDQCTPKKLCDISTEMVNGLKFWTSNLDFDEHVKFAKEIGIDCGASDPKSPCDLDANECKISELCEKATTTEGSDVYWNSEAEAHVDLAKEYGLSCNVEKESSPITNDSCSISNLSNCADTELCSQATFQMFLGIHWHEGYHDGYVIEAKKRGLSCSVNTQNQKHCTSNPKKCTGVETLCHYSTIIEDGLIKWDFSRSAYVAESKRRGLDCGIEDEKNKNLSNQKRDPSASDRCKLLAEVSKCTDEDLCEMATLTAGNAVYWSSHRMVAPHLKEARQRGLLCNVTVELKKKVREELKKKELEFRQTFNRYIKLKRQQIQYALKELHYYSLDIDGLWGKGTLKAITDFIVVEGLHENPPWLVFNKLLKKVSVPSTFSSVQKPKSTSSKSTSSNSSSNTRGWVPLSGNPKLPFDDAKDICEAKAEAEGRSYLNANKPRRSSNSVNCHAFGSRSFSCFEGSSGGMWAGIAEGLASSQARGAAREFAQAIAKACMADYGWIKR